MSISSVGNTDAQARYRQQALNLLASPGQKTAAQSTALSYVALPDMQDQPDSTSFATKFKTDLSMLNDSKDGKAHAHGAHGHHKVNASSQTGDSTTATDARASTDPLQQTLTEFGNLLKTAAGIAALIA